jgi:hypothetical protein
MGKLEIDNYHGEHGDPFKDSSFRGNLSLVPENYRTYIPQDLFQLYVREIVRCKNDPIYFVNNYFYIVSPAKGKHIIDTYDKQDDLLNSFIENNRVVCLASRQVGKCLCKGTKIKLRHKETKEIIEISFEDFINDFLSEMKSLIEEKHFPISQVASDK